LNAVEIEEAVSGLAELPFDAAEFPFAFLEAFGNKATTIKRLRSGTSNKSDVGGVLQTNNIHLKVAEDGAVAEALAAHSGQYAPPSVTTKPNADRLEGLRKMEKLHQERVETRNKLKKEKNLGTQVNLNTRIKQLSESIEAIRKEI
jgi:hypothetical protein